MKIKVIYRRNLKMSEGKLAAQVAHAVVGLRDSYPEIEWDKRIVVLKASDNKFWEKSEEQLEQSSYLQLDWGLTELEEKTPTTLAFYEE